MGADGVGLDRMNSESSTVSAPSPSSPLQHGSIRKIHIARDSHTAVGRRHGHEGTTHREDIRLPLARSLTSPPTLSFALSTPATGITLTPDAWQVLIEDLQLSTSPQDKDRLGTLEDVRKCADAALDILNDLLVFNKACLPCPLLTSPPRPAVSWPWPSRYMDANAPLPSLAPLGM